MADRYEKLGNLLKDYMNGTFPGTNDKKVHVVKQIFDEENESEEGMASAEIKEESVGKKAKTSEKKPSTKKNDASQKIGKATVKKAFIPPEISAAFSKLGLSEEADFETARKTYKAILQQCHPDKKQTEEDKKYAEKRTLEITESWQKIEQWFRSRN